MGLTLDELRKKAKKWDPEAAEKLSRDIQTALEEAYLDGYHGKVGTTPLQTESLDGEFEEISSPEEDLVEAVDALDKAYAVLTDILNSSSTRLSKELRYRASELVDSAGDFLEGMTGLTAYKEDKIH